MSRLNAKSSGVPVLHFPIERFELRCGAKLLVSPRPGAPVTAIEVHLRGGPAFDPPGLEGCAFLTAALFDQGTKRHTEEELADLLEPAGGEVSGDSTGLHGSIVSGDWKLLARTMSEMITEPTFPRAEVVAQRDRLLHRLEVELKDPRREGGKRFRRLVYGEHWLGRPAYGTVESVGQLEPKHLRAFHKKHWVPNRCLIGVCGDVDPEEVRRTFERALGGWKPGKLYKRPPMELPKPSVRVDLFEADRQQVHVYLGHLGIRRRDPDYAALVVMDHVLGTGPGFTNRVSRILRDELGLAYSVSASISSSAGRMPGLFTAYIGTSKEHVSTAIDGFRNEMRRIQDELVPDDELQVAKSYLLGSFPMGLERASRRAGYLISSEVHQLPADNLERLPREFDAVTSADVQRAARKHLFPDRCCLCAAGPVSRRELERALRE